MGKYRKGPVVIQAVQYKGGGNMRGTTPAWLWDALQAKTIEPTNGTDPFMIHASEGDMIVAPNDWIIKDRQGQIYPCRPDVFDAAYKEVDDGYVA